MFTDNFTETTDTNLESHTPSGGTAWTLGGGATGAAIVNEATDALRSRSTTASYYTCDDQGSADHYAEARLKNLSTLYPNSYVTARLADASNFIGWRNYGTGSSGLRLTKMVSGTPTDLITTQGVDEVVYQVEVNGSTAKLYADGSQVGSDQTYSENTTETSIGVRIGSDLTIDWIDDFEAASLGTAPIERSVPDEVLISSRRVSELGKTLREGLTFNDVMVKLVERVLIERLGLDDEVTTDYTSGLPTRYARPDDDDTVGAWLPSVAEEDLFEMVDEVEASDTDYIYTNAASACILRLSDVADPLSSERHVLRVRAMSNESSTLVVTLKQGTDTTIATRTYESLAGWQTYEMSLTTGEADLITDYTDLLVTLEAQAMT